MAEKRIKLSERYSVVFTKRQPLLFDNETRRGVSLTPEIADTLVWAAMFGREMMAHGATMTITFTLPQEGPEYCLRYDPGEPDP